VWDWLSTVLRFVERLTATTDFEPPIRQAGNGDEPVEVQALVAAGTGIACAHRLNVVLEPDQIAVALRGRTDSVTSRPPAVTGKILKGRCQDGSPRGGRRHPGPCPDRFPAVWMGTG
jgi:hypothetical protein